MNEEIVNTHIDTHASKDLSQQGLNEQSTSINRGLVLLLSVACAFTVANLYYIQPLLASIGHEFAVSAGEIGFVATTGQIGYACGLLLIIPLGDTINQRKLIMITLIAVTIALGIMALAPSLFILTIASFLLGLTTVVPQLIIPYAANLAPERSRGQVVGTVMSGLLIGILLARTISGVVGQYLGWRVMYWIAAGLMIVLAIVLRTLLPNDIGTKRSISYPRLLRSLWDLLKSEPILQETSVFGALVFGAFSAFWVTLSFLLETPPYHLGSEVAGLFGLVGVAGALAASFVGRFADRRDARLTNGLSILIVVVSFVLMWLTGQWIIGLVVGVVLLDLGTQANQVSSQTRIYSLDPMSRNRLNTVYMVCYFIGGSLGSLLGTYGWSVGKWNGVCIVSIGMLLIAFAFYLLHSRRARAAREHAVQMSIERLQQAGQ
ncbi:permease [Ktedonobacteria bacterium brp13]|nr:permease [Ktedonobacteria bacterium brp13]